MDDLGYESDQDRHLGNFVNHHAAPRGRSSPFNETEIRALLSLIREYKDIIESVETDAHSKQLKRDAWQMVTARYASNAPNLGIVVPRDEQQLKRRWNSLKAEVRRYDSEVKQYQLKTGGGPSMVELDEIKKQLYDMVRAIKPSLDFTLENPWDSTASFEDHEGSMPQQNAVANPANRRSAARQRIRGSIAVNGGLVPSLKIDLTGDNDDANFSNDQKFVKCDSGDKQQIQYLPNKKAKTEEDQNQIDSSEHNTTTGIPLGQKQEVIQPTNNADSDYLVFDVDEDLNKYIQEVQVSISPKQDTWETAKGSSVVVNAEKIQIASSRPGKDQKNILAIEHYSKLSDQKPDVFAPNHFDDSGIIIDDVDWQSSIFKKDAVQNHFSMETKARRTSTKQEHPKGPQFSIYDDSRKTAHNHRESLMQNRPVTKSNPGLSSGTEGEKIENQRIPFKSLKVDNFLNQDPSVHRSVHTKKPNTGGSSGILQRRLKTFEALGGFDKKKLNDNMRSSSTITSYDQEEKLNMINEQRAQQGEIHREKLELLKKEKELVEMKISVSTLERDVKILEKRKAQLELEKLSGNNIVAGAQAQELFHVQK